MQKHVVIAGGGAAGFFAAINLAVLCKNVHITILEKSGKVLSKVRVSGGGRCNVTHALYDVKLLTEKYPRGKKELISAFSRFNPSQTIEWFARHGVTLKTEADGRIFPVSDNSQTIIDCFLRLCEKYKIDIVKGVGVSQVVKSQTDFEVTTTTGSKLTCYYFVIATGGYSKVNSYNWIKQLGHEIVAPVPSLFTFNIPQFAFKGLEGISVDRAQITIAGTKFIEQGPVLITHWGISGPAAIRLSAWAANYFFEKNYNTTISVNFLPTQTEETLRKLFHEIKKESPHRKIFSKCFDEIPIRLWERICELSGIANDTVFASISKQHIHSLIQNLLFTKLEVKGKTTYKEEFVTCGGVNLKQVDIKTMESKLVPHLYFAGEVLNIDGITGGFNFQAAWTGAWLAANAIAYNENAK